MSIDGVSFRQNFLDDLGLNEVFVKLLLDLIHLAEDNVFYAARKHLFEQLWGAPQDEHFWAFIQLYHTTPWQLCLVYVRVRLLAFLDGVGVDTLKLCVVDEDTWVYEIDQSEKLIKRVLNWSSGQNYPTLSGQRI